MRVGYNESTDTPAKVMMRDLEYFDLEAQYLHKQPPKMPDIKKHG